MNFAEASNRARGVVENSVVKAQADFEVFVNVLGSAAALGFKGVFGRTPGITVAIIGTVVALAVYSIWVP